MERWGLDVLKNATRCETGTAAGFEEPLMGIPFGNLLIAGLAMLCAGESDFEAISEPFARQTPDFAPARGRRHRGA
jgi:hypothetical protein